jgi:dihydroflavonol-4-reductase
MATKTSTKTRSTRKASTKTTKSTAKKTSAITAKKSTALVVKRPQPKTLITGGTGFLGSHLARQLVEAGATNLRVMTTGSAAWLEELGVEVVTGSITNVEDVSRAVKGVSDIYHLAGKVSREDEDARAMHDIHVKGTLLLCEAAKETGIKSIVMASSSGSIAVTEKGDFIPDEDYQPPLDIISRWPYYTSKFYQERTALESFNDKGCRLVILNPSLLLGPGDDRLSSTKVILDFLSRKIPTTPSGGLSFVDVRDAAAAFIAAMEKGKNGQKYLLGSVNWTFSKFFGRLERLTGVNAPLLKLPGKVAVVGSQFINSFYKNRNWASPVQPSEIEMAEHFWYLDSSKAEHELGFAPRDPADTLQDTVKYVRQRFLGQNAFS